MALTRNVWYRSQRLRMYLFNHGRVLQLLAARTTYHWREHELQQPGIGRRYSLQHWSLYRLGKESILGAAD